MTFGPMSLGRQYSAPRCERTPSQRYRSTALGHISATFTTRLLATYASRFKSVLRLAISAKAPSGT
ncbi:hypothetical protein D3C72_589810 [compost metagenome]